jgi:hypothetical protein
MDRDEVSAAEAAKPQFEAIKNGTYQPTPTPTTQPPAMKTSSIQGWGGGRYGSCGGRGGGMRTPNNKVEEEITKRSVHTPILRETDVYMTDITDDFPSVTSTGSVGHDESTKELNRISME